MTPKTVDEPQCGRLGGLGLESPSYGELLVFGRRVCLGADLGLESPSYGELLVLGRMVCLGGRSRAGKPELRSWVWGGGRGPLSFAGFAGGFFSAVLWRVVLLIRQGRERQVVEVEDHFFGQSFPQFFFDCGRFRTTGKVIEFGGIGVQIVEFIDRSWCGEVGVDQWCWQGFAVSCCDHLFPAGAACGIDG